MLKHVYFNHPDTVFLDEQNGEGVYCGLYDVTEEEILFGHVAKFGEAIQIDQGKKQIALAEKQRIEAMAVPKSLTPRQARLALNHFELRQIVEDAVAEADQNVKDEWEFANEILRTWETLVVLAQAINITEEQLDDLFRYGAKL
jgi:hypothetical protein